MDIKIFPHPKCSHFYCLAILPIASSCCTEVSHHISRRLLERVNSCSIQRADGDCDLAAVILHVKRRRICVSPHNRTLKHWMRASEVKKNGKENPCHKKLHSRRDRKSHTPRNHG
ncbi:C-C motif chemokine 28 [Cricetulus griseus]|uniref:C-C motif chemokine n=1 Tax=Cricetulus griseus TaxID=10029 RepID=A0A9J7FE87_CRIGR|nr:C-C motif chemokine 28 [Cricetulus griseus]XP_027294145.2 C-C motif chemokine 28 [Cricetulus griseus]